MLDAVGVPNGPRIYRLRLRRFGLFAPLVPAATMVLVSRLLLFHNGSLMRTAVGFVLSALALPALLALGAPLTSSATTIAVAAVVSAVLWVVLGGVAAQRATRRPAAAWRDFWREFAWLAAPVWCGLGGGIAVVALLLG